MAPLREYLPNLKFAHALRKRFFDSWISTYLQNAVYNWAARLKIPLLRMSAIITIYAFIFLIAVPLGLAYRFHDVFLLFRVLLFDLSIAVFVISVWMAGQWLREKFRCHWEQQALSYKDSLSDSHTDAFIDSFEYSLYYPLPVPDYTPPNIEYKKALLSVISKMTIAFIIMGFSGILFSQVIEHPGISINTLPDSGNSAVPTGAAFVSGLLGPLFGAIALGLASITSRPEDLIILLSVVVIPMIYVGPAARNLISIAEKYHYDRIEEVKNGDGHLHCYLSLSVSYTYVIGNLLVLFYG